MQFNYVLYGWFNLTLPNMKSTLVSKIITFPLMK